MKMNEKKFEKLWGKPILEPSKGLVLNESYSHRSVKLLRNQAVILIVYSITIVSH